jgi:two-component system response regulator (stage 0 sporulation protein A)
MESYQRYFMKPTLIIGEDNLWIREEIGEVLKDEFTILASVGSAKELLDSCQRHEPDLVLIDVVMPHFSGIEVGEALSKSEEKVPRMVFMSEVNSPKSAERILALGAAFIQKPLDFEKLKSLLKRGL